MRITDAAVENINKHLKGHPGKFLRIQAVAGGCAGIMYNMGIDDKKGDDIVVEIKGLKVLVDADTKDLMSDAAIDYDEKEDGFKIDNPKKSGCAGCPGCH